ncbi:MAG: MOSC N-terminal beta barrel domain-containing protein [Nannocystaceae bacterium]
MRLAEIWRYPVKSMAGERMTHATLRTTGIVGDRVVQVRDDRDRVVTSRSRPRLLGHHATLGHDGEPRVDGRPWSDPSVAADVRRAVGAAAALVRDDSLDRFDVLPLLVATDGALAAFGRDPRRLRPNLVVAGVAGLAERRWPGLGLRIGGVVLDMATLRQRCIMTTFDPDTQEQDVGVLLDIHARFQGSLALDCSILVPGEIHVGDEVELLGERS